MIVFLQSSARISTCYSYIGAAVTAAMKLGLHRKARNGSNPIEQELRKRAFWLIQATDTYIGAILGLPTLINLDDVDQELPSEVGDQDITPQGIDPSLNNNKSSIQAASNAHTALHMILAKAVKLLYPTRSPHSVKRQSDNTHIVSYSKIVEVEQDLQKWQQSLTYYHGTTDRLPDYLPRYVSRLLTMA